MVKEKLEKPRETKPIFYDLDVKSYLGALHERLAVVTIGKIANDITFICEKYYISKLLTRCTENEVSG